MRAFCERLLALIFALSVLLTTVTAGRAGPYEDALAHFLADSFDETIEGINGVAASGHPLAETVISALQAGRLFFSVEQKQVFFRNAAETLFDAATGSSVAGAPPPDLAPVRLNNRLRGIIAA